MRIEPMTKLALDTETDGFIATVEHDPHGADESDALEELASLIKPHT